MLRIGTAAYQNATNMQTNDSRLIRQTASTASATSQPLAPDTSTPAKTGDRVSLSPKVELARLRESLGLNPTGKITRQNFETLIQSDQEGVTKTLQAKLDKLTSGLKDPIGTITLRQDAKGQIQVTGDWSGKNKLTKDLNADPEFTKMFTRLARNSGLLNYADQTVAEGKGTTLADYLDSDTADANLSTLLKQYSSMKTSKNPLANLIDLSNSGGKPFSLAYNNGASVQQSPK